VVVPVAPFGVVVFAPSRTRTAHLSIAAPVSVPLCIVTVMLPGADTQGRVKYARMENEAESFSCVPAAVHVPEAESVTVRVGGEPGKVL
jgi:hypothetical protein